jgi:F-type H+-transporting ATPase subunit gamma
MAGLKEVRTRIASVLSTKQITSAMKMVSASKLRRAQNAIVQLRPYATKLNELLQNLSDSIDNTEEAIYFKEKKINKVLLVLVSSNRGMCGAFNSNVIKAANRLISAEYSEVKRKNNLDIICIGKKVSDFYLKRKLNVISTHNEIFDGLTYAKTSEIAETVMSSFVDGKYDKVVIIYNRFKNAAVQIITDEQFLPIKPIVLLETKKKTVEYLIEPDKKELVKEIVPKSLKIQFYKCIIDSFASEHGARMTAMHKATDNAEEIYKQLLLTYNKARQAAITNEILEIVGGADALKN